MYISKRNIANVRMTDDWRYTGWQSTSQTSYRRAQSPTLLQFTQPSLHSSSVRFRVEIFSIPCACMRSRFISIWYGVHSMELKVLHFTCTCMIVQVTYHYNSPADVVPTNNFKNISVEWLQVRHTALIIINEKERNQV